MDGRIFLFKEQLLNKLEQQWTIETMAEAIEISVPHFQKLFKSNVGTPPMMYLHNLRLEKARELLETTFKNISEIRFEICMPNDSHFTRDFKKKFGATPTAYRKQHWEKLQAEISTDKK